MRGQKGCTLECVPPSLIYILTVSLETILGYILLWDMQFLTVLLGMSKAVLRFLISAIILYWEMIALEWNLSVLYAQLSTELGVFLFIINSKQKAPWNWFLRRLLPLIICKQASVNSRDDPLISLRQAQNVALHEQFFFFLVFFCSYSFRCFVKTFECIFLVHILIEWAVVNNMCVIMW